MPSGCLSYRRFSVASYSSVFAVLVLVSDYVFVAVLFCPSFASTTMVFGPRVEIDQALKPEWCAAIRRRDLCRLAVNLHYRRFIDKARECRPTVIPLRKDLV